MQLSWHASIKLNIYYCSLLAHTPSWAHSQRSPGRTRHILLFTKYTQCFSRTQVPPIGPCSTMATLAPSCDAFLPQASPPDPAPRTNRSNVREAALAAIMIRNSSPYKLMNVDPTTLHVYTCSKTYTSVTWTRDDNYYIYYVSATMIFRCKWTYNIIIKK